MFITCRYCCLLPLHFLSTLDLGVVSLEPRFSVLDFVFGTESLGSRLVLLSLVPRITGSNF